jgi:hypothetical protein
MDNMEKAFANYFGTTIKEDVTKIIAEKSDTTYTYKENQINPRENIKNNYFTLGELALMADNNIDGIDQLCNILKKLLNAAWGSNWGEISPDLKKGEDSSKIIVPQITVDVNNRDIAEKMPLKPVLINTVKEKVNGQYTGDSLLIYRQWFDCVVEFDFYGRTSKETRDLQYKFESLLAIYTGYLKRQGVSEIIFLKEVSARNSLNFIEQTPMKCLMYWVRFERITPVRQSLINKINANIGVKAINDEAIKMVIEANQNISNNQDPVEIEFDFFNQDTGVDYEDI